MAAHQNTTESTEKKKQEKPELTPAEKKKKEDQDQVNRSINMSMGLDEGMPKDLELKDDV